MGLEATSAQGPQQLGEARAWPWSRRAALPGPGLGLLGRSAPDAEWPEGPSARREGGG